MRQRVIPIASLVVLLILSAGSALAAADLWLHVRVEEQDGATVRVNLPATMLEKAMGMIPEEHFHEGRIEIDEWHTSTAELRELWTELKNSPDMTFVTVEEDDEFVRVWKEAGYLKVNVREGGDGEVGGENVDVSLPMTVVDALLSGDDSELNITAAIEALVAEGEGELVTVTGDDEKVRVWVDRVADAE
jgi:hypothetical protein